MDKKYIDAVKIHEDLIRTIIDDINNPAKNTVFDSGWRQGVQYAAFVIENEPAADVVEVRHGRWVDDETAYICSVCFHGSPSGAKWNYCPHCGAKMGEVEE